MSLPTFRYHPDPLASGSVVASDKPCIVCKQQRGYLYDGPVYGEGEDIDDICPWCIADGGAHAKLDVTFVDDRALDDDISPAVLSEVTCRTPGFASWQTEQWPCCCDDATAFLKPVGIAEIRRDHYEWEGTLMGHIVHDMQISGGAARRLLDSLHRDSGPTAYAFLCLHCHRTHFYIDQL